MANWGPFEWLRRAVTAPAAKNSLADIFGQDVADVLSGTLRALVAQAVTNALGTVADNAILGASTIGTIVSREAKKALSNVSPSLASEIDLAVQNGVGAVAQVAQKDVPVLSQLVTNEIAKVLKI